MKIYKIMTGISDHNCTTCLGLKNGKLQPVELDIIKRYSKRGLNIASGATGDPPQIPLIYSEQLFKIIRSVIIILAYRLFRTNGRSHELLLQKLDEKQVHMRWNHKHPKVTRAKGTENVDSQMERWEWNNELRGGGVQKWDWGEDGCNEYNQAQNLP